MANNKEQLKLVHPLPAVTTVRLSPLDEKARYTTTQQRLQELHREDRAMGRLIIGGAIAALSIVGAAAVVAYSFKTSKAAPDKVKTYGTMGMPGLLSMLEKVSGQTCRVNFKSVAGKPIVKSEPKSDLGACFQFVMDTHSKRLGQNPTTSFTYDNGNKASPPIKGQCGTSVEPGMKDVTCAVSTGGIRHVVVTPSVAP